MRKRAYCIRVRGPKGIQYPFFKVIAFKVQELEQSPQLVQLISPGRVSTEQTLRHLSH